MKIKLPSQGKIITFYSYKGGTGRSMALANIACLLAQKEDDGNILMIDWDLEAPGLHRYFQNQIATNTKYFGSFETQKGLIDLFQDMKTLCERNEIEDDEISETFFNELGIENYYIETKRKSLWLMTSGKYDSTYATRVASFDWENLFNNFPSLFVKFAEFLSKKFKYVLIDSRTGHTDTSGICTALMPDQLVVVFTPNNQSIVGALNVTSKAVEYRKQSDDLRQLIVFPLVSRVEPAEPTLREEWRFGSSEKNIDGYQSLFENLFIDAYTFTKCDLTSYFDDIQIQYVPRYSYGEEIAVIAERSEDRLSLARSYENFIGRLIDQGKPWDIPSQEDTPLFIDKSKQIAKQRIGKMEKTVFICYRRANLPWALAIYQSLTMHGYDVFFDYLSINSEMFETTIIENIKARAHFLVILTHSALERCNEPGDWLRREIETAMDEKRNIVPIMVENFDFGDPYVTKSLIGKLDNLKKYNGLRVPSEYFFEAMDKLRNSFLSVSLETELHPISKQTMKVTETLKATISDEKPIRIQKLSAQEWFERGFRLNNNSLEEINSYTQAILLDPSFAEAYANRGLAKKAVKDFDGAIFDFKEALRIKPDLVEVHNYLGEAYAAKGELTNALESFNIAIKLRPDSSVAFSNRGDLFLKEGEYDNAIKDYTEAVDITPEYTDLYKCRARAWELKKDYYSAIADYENYLEATGDDSVTNKIAELKSKITKN